MFKKTQDQLVTRQTGKQSIYHQSSNIFKIAKKACGGILIHIQKTFSLVGERAQAACTFLEEDWQVFGSMDCRVSH